MHFTAQQTNTASSMPGSLLNVLSAPATRLAAGARSAVGLNVVTDWLARLEAAGCSHLPPRSRDHELEGHREVGMRIGTGEQVSPTVQVEFPASDRHAADVRSLVKDHLTELGLVDAINDTVLAASEVFANAVKHGSSHETDTVLVEVECATDVLRVAITDSSCALPVRQAATGWDVSGRGLALVEAVSDRWGADLAQDGSGKQVWFTLAHSAPA